MAQQTPESMACKASDDRVQQRKGPEEGQWKFITDGFILTLSYSRAEDAPFEEVARYPLTDALLLLEMVTGLDENGVDLPQIQAFHTWLMAAHSSRDGV